MKKDKKTNFQTGIPDVVQQCYEELKIIDESLENNPNRWLQIMDKEGKSHLIDCKQSYAVIYKKIRDLGGTEEDVQEGRKRRKSFEGIYLKKANLTKTINREARRSGSLHGLDFQSAELLEMFGQYYTIEEVISTVRKKWGYTVTADQVRSWYKHNENIIVQKRAQYTLENKGFRVAHETGRLHVLNDLLATWQDRHRTKPNENAANVIIRILEQARKEVKGNEVKLSIDGKLDINAMVQANDSVLAVSRQLPINMLIIGLVAAKQGLNPLVLMTQLASSYYGKVNGFNGEITGNEKIPYPSNLIKTYDWGKLEQMHNKENPANLLEDILKLEDVNVENKAKQGKKDLLSALAKFEERLK